MSRIYFHSPSGDADVHGPERHMAGRFCGALTVTALGLDQFSFGGDRSSPLRHLVPPDHYLHGDRDEREFLDGLRTLVMVMDGNLVCESGTVPLFHVALNTAMAMGSDPIRLMARLHGQCEVHAYVEGPNRAWLADIIETGRASGIMRAGMGWESAVELLRSRADEPVVTSYSVCEQFPDAGVARDAGLWEPDGDDWDGWYEITREEQWRLCLAALRGENGGAAGFTLEMKPENWTRYYFGRGVNAFALTEWAQRRAAGLAQQPSPSAR